MCEHGEGIKTQVYVQNPNLEERFYQIYKPPATVQMCNMFRSIYTTGPLITLVHTCNMPNTHTQKPSCTQSLNPTVSQQVSVCLQCVTVALLQSVVSIWCLHTQPQVCVCICVSPHWCLLKTPVEHVKTGFHTTTWPEWCYNLKCFRRWKTGAGRNRQRKCEWNSVCVCLNCHMIMFPLCVAGLRHLSHRPLLLNELAQST